MRRALILILAFAVILTPLGSFTAMAKDKVDAIFYYVAVNGDDANPGTINAPLATFAAARDRARMTDKQVVVNVRGGIYRFSGSVDFSTQDKNVVFRAYHKEKVVLSGAQPVSAASFSKLNEVAQNRLIEQAARDEVVAVDLHTQGIEEYGKLMRFDHLMEGDFAPALYYNDVMLPLGRYPNDGYLNIDQVVEKGTAYLPIYKGEDTTTDPATCVPFSIVSNDSRISKYTEANDPWIFGYFRYNWADAQFGAKIDFENGNIITAKDLSAFGAVSGQRFYFFNLLEEIDRAGEWYLDRETGMLYLYPADSELSSAKIEFSSYNDSFFEIDGSENLCFENLEMDKSIGNAFVLKNAKKIDINACTFSNISGTVVLGEQLQDCTIRNCHAFQNGSTVFSLTGGDYETLTYSNNMILNNHIEDYGNIKETNSPGISVRGVGSTISHNEIHDAPHQAISYFGNEHVIEYNNIYDVCKNTSDAGAIYSGRRWQNRGNVIRYNYFHDIAQDVSNGGVHAVYLDDMHSSTAVYSNVFYQLSSVALYGGGRDNTFVNNLMIDCKTPFKMDARGASGTQQWDRLIEIMKTYLLVESPFYKNTLWAQKYPSLVNILEDEPNVPKYNILRGNVLYNTDELSISANVRKYSTVEGSLVLSDTKSFTNYTKKDFTLLENSEVFRKIPDFQAAPFRKIGRYPYKVYDLYTQIHAQEGLSAAAGLVVR